MYTHKVKVKSIFYCLLWCIKNGISRPRAYYLTRWSYSLYKEDEHNMFSYDKFKRCGKIYPARKIGSWKPDYYEVWAFEFHKDLLIFLE